MTPLEFKASRIACGLNQGDWALALGYESHDRSGLRQQINDMEAGRKPISRRTARLAEILATHGVPPHFLTPAA